MLNLIKADLYRIFKDKIFWIMIIICGAFAILYPLFNFGIYLFDRSTTYEYMVYNGASDDVIQAALAQVDGNYNAFGVSFVAITTMSVNAFIVPIFFLILLSKDVMNGTIRNKVIVGKKRSEIFLANLSISVIGVLAINLACAIIGLLISMMFFHSGLTLENFASYCLRLLMTLIGWVAIGFAIAAFATVLKNVGLGIVCYMVMYYVLFLGGFILMSFLPLIQNTGNNHLIMFANGVLNSNIFYSMMMTIPPTGGLGFSSIGELTGGPTMDAYFYVEYIAGIVAMCFAFFSLGFFVFKVKDLK